MGFHPDSSSFERRSADLREARHDLWLWAEPVIIDRAVEAYVRFVDEAGTAAMARRHCRLWRAVLCVGVQALGPLLEEMRGTALSLGLTEAMIDDVDDVILEELVDIVACRYRSSRRTMKTFSMVLIGATAELESARVSV